MRRPARAHSRPPGSASPPAPWPRPQPQTRAPVPGLTDAEKKNIDYKIIYNSAVKSYIELNDGYNLNNYYNKVTNDRKDFTNLSIPVKIIKGIIKNTKNIELFTLDKYDTSIKKLDNISKYLQIAMLAGGYDIQYSILMEKVFINILKFHIIKLNMHNNIKVNEFNIYKRTLDIQNRKHYVYNNCIEDIKCEYLEPGYYLRITDKEQLKEQFKELLKRSEEHTSELESHS